MDPVTHFLYGATLARTGLNRKAAYTTLAMTLAAETPDIDVVWSAGGPVTAFQHHRGITHTFIALPFEAAVVLGVVYAIHRIRVHRARETTSNAPTPPKDLSFRPEPERGQRVEGEVEKPGVPGQLAGWGSKPGVPGQLAGWGSKPGVPGQLAGWGSKPASAPAQPLTQAPIRWPLLYAFVLLALLSHLFLDFTNNYGLRPFFPFNPRWYQLSTVFIIEPLILLFLILGLLAPALFGLIAGEVGARRKPFRGRAWAAFALLAIAALWGFRQVEHDSAIDLATNAPYGPAGAPIPPDQVLRVTASPSPINPFVWHTVAETPAFFQLATVDTHRNIVDTDPAHDLLYKPPSTVATLLAKRSFLGEVYLDWSSWPLVTDQGPAPLPGSPASATNAPTQPTEVLFRDLRFLYNTTGMSGRQDPPLAGQVFIDLTQPESGRIVGMYLNGNPQH